MDILASELSRMGRQQHQNKHHSQSRHKNNETCSPPPPAPPPRDTSMLLGEIDNGTLLASETAPVKVFLNKI